MHKDKSLILSGAALQLAMQIGLHVIGNGQDFARIRGYKEEMEIGRLGYEKKVFHSRFEIILN